MGKLTASEKDQISRVEKTLGMKLTKQQIIGILGRNPFEKKSVGRPIAKTKVKRMQVEEKRQQRALRKEAAEKGNLEPLHLKKLFAERIHRRQKKNQKLME